MKKYLKWLWLLLIPVILLLAYVAYLFLSYHRLPDNQVLPIDNKQTQQLKTDTPYTAMTFNIGYGAYPQDYSFFMDGGKYSRAYDKQTVENNLAGIITSVRNVSPDIVAFQEVDVDGDRSQHVNEVQLLKDAFPNQTAVFTQNYDSAYLFYPFTDPIGKASSGLLTLTSFQVDNAMRYALPIDTDFNKFFDLDRAFSVHYLPVANGKQLAVFNLHLSAYTQNDTVREGQLAKLVDKLNEAYAQGHYVLVAGDFNHDLLDGKAPSEWGQTASIETWTHPFPAEKLPKNFTLVNTGLAQAGIPTARAMSTGYEKGKTYVALIDGFIVSDNITVESVQALDLAFQNTDHNPVVLQFKLK